MDAKNSAPSPPIIGSSWAFDEDVERSSSMPSMTETAGNTSDTLANSLELPDDDVTDNSLVSIAAVLAAVGMSWTMEDLQELSEEMNKVTNDDATDDDLVNGTSVFGDSDNDESDNATIQGPPPKPMLSIPPRCRLSLMTASMTRATTMIAMASLRYHLMGTVRSYLSKTTTES